MNARFASTILPPSTTMTPSKVASARRWYRLSAWRRVGLYQENPDQSADPARQGQDLEEPTRVAPAGHFSHDQHRSAYEQQVARDVQTVRQGRERGSDSSGVRRVPDRVGRQVDEHPPHEQVPARPPCRAVHAHPGDGTRYGEGLHHQVKDDCRDARAPQAELEDGGCQPDSKGPTPEAIAHRRRTASRLQARSQTAARTSRCRRATRRARSACSSGMPHPGSLLRPRQGHRLA